MYNTQLEFGFKLNTNGEGYWSDVAKEVQLTKIELDVMPRDADDSDDGEFGELRVYFITNTWNVNEYGLIYTDEQFMDELRGALEVVGLDDSDIGYSEQGMQGRDYVSLDVGDKFIKSWALKEWAVIELAGK
ncbi:MAG: hypothetical protein V3R32_05515 [Nitrosomonadaceae bacterium]